jgi:hypothetical protein
MTEIYRQRPSVRKLRPMPIKTITNQARIQKGKRNANVNRNFLR